MKTLKDLQKSTEETIKIWGYDYQRDFFKTLTTGRWGTRWADIYRDIDTLHDPEIKAFAEKCKSIDLNNLSKKDIEDLTTLVWASILADGAEF